MKTFKKAPIAIAIASMFLSSAALAGGSFWDDFWDHIGGDNNITEPDDSQAGTGFEASSSISSEVTNTKNIGVDHETNFSSDVSVHGGVFLWGKGYVGSLTDSKQVNNNNTVHNNRTENSGEIDGGAFRNSSGNIGANVAGGDNNQQANDAALATSDAEMVFARATSASFQSSSNNTTNNTGVSNSAGMSGNAFRNSSGNIAVNAAAGAGNSQQNAFSAAVSDGSNGSAEATSVGVQQSWNNVTRNALAEVSSTKGFYPVTYDSPTTNNANIGGNAFREASGNVSANVASGTGNMQRNSMSIARGVQASQ